MHRRNFIKGSAAMGLAASCIGCSQTEEPTTVEHYFRYGENQATNYPTTKAAYYFAELVELRSSGRIKIIVYPEASLGDESTVIEQVQLGMIDFARVSLGALCEFIPFLNVLQLPFLYESAAHMWRVLDGEIGDTCLSVLSDFNLHGMSWYDAGARSFYTTQKPIQTLEDLAGLQIRVQESRMIGDMITALGANPITLVFDEVYSNLQSQSIDGAENNFPSYDSMEHYSVAPYFSEVEHIRIPEIQLISKTTLAKLSEADQIMMLAAAQESAIYERTLWSEQETSSKEKVQAGGAQIFQLNEGERDRFIEAVLPLYQSYCGDDMDIITAIQAQT
ncbi:MAG: TRAP transporter substrate-binding protein DctP [Faecalibacterium sp.]